MRDVLFRLVYGGTPGLRPHEQRVFDAIASSVEPETRDRLVAQMSALRLVQRFNRDRQVNLFFRELGPSQRFPARGDELRAFRVDLVIESTRSHCDLVMHDGAMSSLEFASNADLSRANHLRVTRVRATAELDADSPVAIRDCALKSLARRVYSCKDPASTAVRDEALARIGASTMMRDQLAELWAESDGFRIGQNGSFYGTRFRVVGMKDRDLIVLAEWRHLSLCIERSGGTAGRVVTWNAEDERAELVHAGILDGLGALLQRAESVDGEG